MRIRIFIIIITAVLISCNNYRDDQINVRNGILDLRSWNFERDGVIALNGPWKFQWLQDSTVFTDSNYDDGHWDNLKIPTTWEKATGESYGYGWLRLKVITNTDDLLLFYIHGILGAYSLYCNDEHILSSGIPGNKKEDYVISNTSKCIVIPKSDTLQLAWKLSNFDDKNGGPRFSIIAGNSEKIQKYIISKVFINSFILGIILIMAIYQIMMWAARKKDLASLYFSMFCFVIFLRIFTYELFLSWFVDTSEIVRIQTKINYLTIPFAGITFILFITNLFSDAASKKIKILILIMNSVIALTILFTRIRQYSSVILIIEIVTIITVLYAIYIVLKSIFNKSAYSRHVFFGLIVMSSCVLFDIINYNITNTSSLYISMGFLLFIIIESHVLTLQFRKAYRTAEHLSLNLKEEVEKKTRDIQQKSMELEKINKELKKADEYKTRFFQNITHEFKTPLTLITGPAQQILSEQFGRISEGVKKHVHTIKQNGIRMLNMVNQLLELSKSDMKELELTFIQQDIYEILKYVISNFETIAENSKIHLTLKRCTDNSIYSYIDSEKFEKIFFNLISNALKFTPENGSIMLSVKDKKDKNGQLCFEIRIKDTGAGISEENIPHIFKRFYKVYGQNGTADHGTGIGLSLVQEYTKLHGGRINFNTAENEGAEFILEFPVINNEQDFHKYVSPDYQKIKFVNEMSEVKHIKLSEPEFDLKRTEKKNIIMERFDEIIENNNEDKRDVVVIVEDNHDMRDYIKSIIEGTYKIYEASDGEEGLKIIHNYIPDLVISDIMMPKIGGIELCKAIKSNTETEHIPVILLTARSEVDDSIEGYLTGADDYIIKPFNRELLKIRIENLIESRRKIRENLKTRFLLENNQVNVEHNNDKFINKAISFIDKKISDENYNVSDFAENMGLSRIQLYRKMETIIGYSPAEFIRIVRLKRAAKILEDSMQRDINISEVAYKVGFTSHSHFSYLFKKYYHVSPTDYASKFSIN